MPVVVFWIIFGYVLYIIVLGNFKIKYTSMFNKWRYINSIIYYIDPHKPAVGWIDYDQTETYPLELSEKDESRIKSRKIENDIEYYTKQRNVLLDLLGKSKEDDEDTENDEDDEDDDKNTDNNDDSNKDTKIKKKIGKQLKKIDSILATLHELKLKQEKENSEIFSKAKEAVKRTANVNDISNYVIYRSKIKWSNIYPNVDEIIQILPSTIDNTYIFSNGKAVYQNVFMDVSNYTSASFVEVDYFKNRPYLLCISSNWHVQNSQLTTIKKEIAGLLTLNAEFRFLADETSKIQTNYKTLKYENMRLLNRVKSYKNQLKKQQKRHKTELESMESEKELSFELPPKKYYAITIIGWILFVLFAILYIINSFNNNITITK